MQGGGCQHRLCSFCWERRYLGDSIKLGDQQIVEPGGVKGFLVLETRWYRLERQKVVVGEALGIELLERLWSWLMIQLGEQARE